MPLPRARGYLDKMASLLPLIQDILPMILPASVSVTKAADILPSDATQPSEEAEGAKPAVRVITRHAVVDKSEKMCASGTATHMPECPLPRP
jgi:hypothetical protein